MTRRGPSLAGVAVVAALIVIAGFVAHALGAREGSAASRPWPWAKPAAAPRPR